MCTVAQLYACNVKRKTLLVGFCCVVFQSQCWHLTLLLMFNFETLPPGYDIRMWFWAILRICRISICKEVYLVMTRTLMSMCTSTRSWVAYVLVGSVVIVASCCILMLITPSGLMWSHCTVRFRGSEGSVIAAISSLCARCVCWRIRLLLDGWWWWILDRRQESP